MKQPHSGDWVVRYELIGHGVAHDLSAWLKNALGDVQGARRSIFCTALRKADVGISDNGSEPISGKMSASNRLRT